MLDPCKKRRKNNFRDGGTIASGKSNLQNLQMHNSVKLSFLDTLYYLFIVQKKQITALSMAIGQSMSR